MKTNVHFDEKYICYSRMYVSGIDLNNKLKEFEASENFEECAIIREVIMDFEAAKNGKSI